MRGELKIVMRETGRDGIVAFEVDTDGARTCGARVGWMLAARAVLRLLAFYARLFEGEASRADPARRAMMRAMAQPNAAPHPSNRVTLENVEQLFHYRRPTPETIPHFEAINTAGLAFARAILEHAPDCADRSAAVRWVTLARMQANAAIATAQPVEDTSAGEAKPAT